MGKLLLLKGSGPGGAVDSVFGRAGNVTAEASDYSTNWPADVLGVPRFTYGAGGLAGGVITVPGSNDWTVARSSAGVYVVTFNKPFDTEPAVTLDAAVTAVSTNHGAYLSSGSVTVDGFTALTETGNAAADLEFHFQAIGT